MTEHALSLAKRCAEVMWADDRASRALGMQIADVGPGRATLTMTVTDTMTNGHGMCHGGFIFTLAIPRLRSRATHTINAPLRSTAMYVPAPGPTGRQADCQMRGTFARGAQRHLRRDQ